MIKQLVKRILTEDAQVRVRQLANPKEREKRRIKALPPFSEREFREILVHILKISSGDTVFIHSAVGGLNLGFDAERIISMLLDIVGPMGTLVFPTYPELTPAQFLIQDEIFDITETPSYMGLLTELARKNKDAIRSLNPTKSVCAIGYEAKAITMNHQDSLYPYDYCSPYFKIVELKGIIIGLGVPTETLSFVHCVDDYFKDDFPVQPYLPIIFEGRCIDCEGNRRFVKTYAHDPEKMKHNVPLYMEQYINKTICRDMSLYGRRFFRADAIRLFSEMVNLARSGITIYPRSCYIDHLRNNSEKYSLV